MTFSIYNNNNANTIQWYPICLITHFSLLTGQEIWSDSKNIFAYYLPSATRHPVFCYKTWKYAHVLVLATAYSLLYKYIVNNLYIAT
jgi:uncharacterized membrane protein